MPITRLLRFLTLLAVLFAPVSMASTHSALAMPAASAAPMADHGAAAAPSGHCAQLDLSGEEAPAEGTSSEDADCTIACSCTPPAAGHPIAEPVPFAPLADRPELDLLMAGLSPQAEPRPPQLS